MYSLVKKEISGVSIKHQMFVNYDRFIIMAVKIILLQQQDNAETRYKNQQMPLYVELLLYLRTLNC